MKYFVFCGLKKLRISNFEMWTQDVIFVLFSEKVTCKDVPAQETTHNALKSTHSNPPPGLTQAPAPTQPTKASFAAAAGKGLPTTLNDQTLTTSNASSSSSGLNSKYFEKLNSVREALLDPNGWGGSNVKQDSIWNVESIPNATNPSKNNSGQRCFYICRKIQFYRQFFSKARFSKE